MQLPNGFQIEREDDDLIIRKFADNNTGSPLQGEVRVSIRGLEEGLLADLAESALNNPDSAASTDDAASVPPDNDNTAESGSLSDASDPDDEKDETSNGDEKENDI